MKTTPKFALSETLLAAAALSLLMTVAHGEPLDPHPSAKPISRTVSLHDLDLATHEGTEALHGRVVAAAREICWGGFSRRIPAPAEARYARRCFDEAVSQAMAEIGTSAGSAPTACGCRPAEASPALVAEGATSPQQPRSTRRSR